MAGHHVCRRAPLLLGIVAVWAGLAADAAGQGSTAMDRTALEAIYRATGGDDWTDNTNWLSNAPLEDWYGVEVADGRVTGLRLGGWDETAREYVGNGLVGSLPPELGALSHLLWLEVGGNSGLTGPIPVELGNLGNLKSLFLQENWLTDSIPAALGQLENLEWLALDRNALTGSIPADLGNLQYLRGLTFGGNTLSGPVPPEFGNLSSLVDLYLGNTMLGGPLPASMSRSIGARVAESRRERPVRTRFSRHASVGGRDRRFQGSCLRGVGELLAQWPRSSISAESISCTPSRISTATAATMSSGESTWRKTPLRPRSD